MDRSIFIATNFGTNFNILDTIRDVTDIQQIYSGLARRNGNWYSLDVEASGFKKAICIILLANYSDIAVIENFENSLHIDLAYKLINVLNSMKYVVVETHLGLLLRWGIANGWNVYYVDEGKALKLTQKELYNIKLFRKELEVYGV